MFFAIGHAIDVVGGDLCLDHRSKRSLVASKQANLSQAFGLLSREIFELPFINFDRKGFERDWVGIDRVNGELCVNFEALYHGPFNFVRQEHPLQVAWQTPEVVTKFLKWESRQIYVLDLRTIILVARNDRIAMLDV